MDLSPGPSPRSRTRSRVSLVRPAATATITAAATLADSSRSARRVSPVPSRAITIVIDLDDEVPMRPSVHRARVAVLARAVGRISASAAGASASMTPAAPCHFGLQQRNRQAVNYAMNPRDTAHKSSSSAKILTEETEGGEVTPAAAADVPTSGPAPARGASHSCAPAVDAAPTLGAIAPAGCGSQRHPSWLPAGADLSDPNPLGLTTVKGNVLPSDVAERVVQRGPVVPCIRCLER
jgi:hypothetical protein